MQQTSQQTVNSIADRTTRCWNGHALWPGPAKLDTGASSRLPVSMTMAHRPLVEQTFTGKALNENMNPSRAQTRQLARLRCGQSAFQACFWTALCAVSSLALVGLRAPAQTPAPTESVQNAMRQGAEAMTSGNFAAAISEYTSVTREMPDFAEGHFNLGLALYQAGQLDDARAGARQGARLKPGLRGANLFLGLIDYRENRFKDADDDVLNGRPPRPPQRQSFHVAGCLPAG